MHHNCNSSRILRIVIGSGHQSHHTSLHRLDNALIADRHYFIGSSRRHTPCKALVTGIVGQHLHQTVQIGCQVVTHITFMLVQIARNPKTCHRLQNRHCHRLIRAQSKTVIRRKILISLHLRLASFQRLVFLYIILLLIPIIVEFYNRLILTDPTYFRHSSRCDKFVCL